MNVFIKSSNDSLYTRTDSNYNTANETESEEVIIDDINDNFSQIELNNVEDDEDQNNIQDSSISAILEICLKTFSKDVSVYIFIKN